MNGRPHRQSGSAQLRCGSNQSGPPGRFCCREGASKTHQLEHSDILILDIKSNRNNLFCTEVFVSIQTMSTSSFLEASPMLLRAMSTSFWPGRQFTQLFRECETALATCNTAQCPVSDLPLAILTMYCTICPRAKPIRGKKIWDAKCAHSSAQ